MFPQIYMTLSVSWLCFWLLVSPLFALGTAAGTQILNTVEVTFRVGDNAQAQYVKRASDVFTVSEIIRSNISTLNPDGVATPTPGQNVPLSFQLTNTGNGAEAFRLVPRADNGSDFSAAVTQLWVESNGEPGWQPDDASYDAVNGVALAADEGVVVYVLSDIPAELADEARGEVILTAVSATTGAAELSAGEALSATENEGVEAVVAQDNASTQDSSAYVVSGIQLSVDKSIVSVVDPYGGDLVMPGAAVTYQIRLTAAGRGVAKALRVNDPTPDNMAYRNNTLTLNGEPLTDRNDFDSGHFDEADQKVWFTPGTINAPLTQIYTVTYVVD